MFSEHQEVVKVQWPALRINCIQEMVMNIYFNIMEFLNKTITPVIQKKIIILLKTNKKKKITFDK